jgi:hypothetical protein
VPAGKNPSKRVFDTTVITHPSSRRHQKRSCQMREDRVITPEHIYAKARIFSGVFGDSCGSFQVISGLQRRKHGGEDLEPEILLVA